MLTGEKYLGNGRSLELFQNKSCNVTQDLMDHLFYQQDEFMILDSFEYIRQQSGNVEYHVRWKGLSTDEDSWEPMDALAEELSVLLKEHLQDLKTSRTPR